MGRFGVHTDRRDYWEIFVVLSATTDPSRTRAIGVRARVRIRMFVPVAIWRSELDICGNRVIQAHLCGGAPYQDDAGWQICLSVHVVSDLYLDRGLANGGTSLLAVPLRSQDGGRLDNARRLHLLAHPWGLGPADLGNDWCGMSGLNLCDLLGQDPLNGP